MIERRRPPRQLEIGEPKTCRVCGETKSRNDFPRNRSRKDGIDTRCSECNRAAVKAWQAENKDRALERCRLWQRENDQYVRATKREAYHSDPEEHTRKSAEWRRANPEKRRAIQARYQEKNAEEIRARGREAWRRITPEQLERRREAARAWKAANPEKVRRGNFVRRARHMDDESQEWLFDVLPGDPCAYCGGPADHVDHIHPIALGGGNHWTNLTAACARCNQSKNATPMLLWMAS